VTPTSGTVRLDFTDGAPREVPAEYFGPLCIHESCDHAGKWNVTEPSTGSALIRYLTHEHARKLAAAAQSWEPWKKIKGNAHNLSAEERLELAVNFASALTRLKIPFTFDGKHFSGVVV